MRRSRSAELAIVILLGPRSGDRECDRAVETARFDRKGCPSSELIGQGVLDEAAATSGPARLSGSLSGLDAIFLPVDKNPWRPVLGLHAPTNVEARVLLA